jgi:hypothetical protein
MMMRGRPEGRIKNPIRLNSTVAIFFSAATGKTTLWPLPESEGMRGYECNQALEDEFFFLLLDIDP